jgi:hypothetical protein
MICLVDASPNRDKVVLSGCRSNEPIRVHNVVFPDLEGSSRASSMAQYRLRERTIRLVGD